jgi:hypothetical protein
MQNDVKTLSGLDNLLLKYAKAIDDIDMFLGPTSTLALWHDNKTIRALGTAATILDVGVIKTPFVVMYVARTKDYQSAIEWLGWEILAHAIPYEGGCLSIRRNYEHNTKEYYENKKHELIKNYNLK